MLRVALLQPAEQTGTIQQGVTPSTAKKKVEHAFLAEEGALQWMMGFNALPILFAQRQVVASQAAAKFYHPMARLQVGLAV